MICHNQFHVTAVKHPQAVNKEKSCGSERQADLWCEQRFWKALVLDFKLGEGIAGGAWVRWKNTKYKYLNECFKPINLSTFCTGALHFNNRM